jgi:hypothetical protein
VDTVFAITEQSHSTELLSILAFFVAVIALFTSIWQGIIARTHNRKSVRPIPDLYLGNFINQVQICVRNYGIGPLLVKNFSVSGSGKQADSIVEIVCSPPNDFPWANYSCSTQFTISAGEEKEMLRFELPKIENRHCNTFLIQLKSELSKLVVEFDYEDIYGKQQHFTHDLTWYA